MESSDVCKFVGHSAAGFSLGCLSGLISRAPILLSGGLSAVTAALNFVSETTYTKLATKHEWKFSTVCFFNALSGMIRTTAFAIAGVALGIFSAMTAALTLAGSIIFFAIPLVVGIIAIAKDDDCKYIYAKSRPQFYFF